jgi:deazaflavin-dependent oxidoreductase (nitroreductase family)
MYRMQRLRPAMFGRSDRPQGGLMEKIGEPKRPKGLTRALYRIPIALYRMGLGALMGERFLHLTHTGRSTGLKREAVIEVVDHDDRADVYYLASGWGRKSDWYRNVLATPQVHAQVGRRKFQGRAWIVDGEDASALFWRYGNRHPRTLQALARVMGYRIQADDEDYRALGRVVPVVAIHVEVDMADRHRSVSSKNVPRSGS